MIHFFFLIAANNVFKVAIIIAEKLANKQQDTADLCSPFFSVSLVSVFISFNCFQVDEDKKKFNIFNQQHQHPFYIFFL